MVNNVMDLRLLMLILENLWPNKQSICNLPSPHVIGKAQTQRANHLAMGPHTSPMRKGTISWHFPWGGRKCTISLYTYVLVVCFFFKRANWPLVGPNRNELRTNFRRKKVHNIIAHCGCLLKAKSALGGTQLKLNSEQTWEGQVFRAPTMVSSVLGTVNGPLDV